MRLESQRDTPKACEHQQPGVAQSATPGMKKNNMNDPGGIAAPSIPKRQRAFTLVEILTSVAVLAILIALLVSGMGNLKGKATAAKCAGNLRQVAVLMNTYAAEHNGWYPRDAYWQGYKGGGVRYAPEHFLLDYDGFVQDADGRFVEEAAPAAGSIFRCPGEPSTTDFLGRVWYQSHYGFNFYLVHTTAEEMANPGSTNPYRRPIQAIENPSKVFLAGDTRNRYAFNATGGTSGTLAFRHGSAKTCNIAFVDGHVETLPSSSQGAMLGGPAALGWDQFIEWGGSKMAPGSPRY